MSKYSDSQTIGKLKQAEAGTPARELCREQGMSSTTFYKWRAKYGGMDASLMARLNEVALNAFEHNGARIRLACAVVGIIETCCRYRPKLCDDNAQIAD